MNKGLFITFEGGEACGKTTQVEKLKAYINSLDNRDNFLLVREPGGTLLGEGVLDYSPLSAWIAAQKRDVYLLREEMDISAAKQDIDYMMKL